MSVSRLDWDSEFFGFPIGRADDTDVASAAKQASDQGLTCVYVESPTLLDTAGSDLRLTDRRVTLERDTSPTEPAENVRVAHDDDRDALDPLLDRLAPWSRFARDPGFGVDAARRMYGAWLDRAFAHESVGIVYGDGLEGFVTVNRSSPAEIGLISVAQEGAGTGSALVSWAAALASPKKLRVVTQADNTRALALYERNGFERVSETLVYHLWLKDNEAHG